MHAILHCPQHWMQTLHCRHNKIIGTIAFKVCLSSKSSKLPFLNVGAVVNRSSQVQNRMCTLNVYGCSMLQVNCVSLSVFEYTRSIVWSSNHWIGNVYSCRMSENNSPDRCDDWTGTGLSKNKHQQLFLSFSCLKFLFICFFATQTHSFPPCIAHYLGWQR